MTVPIWLLSFGVVYEIYSCSRLNLCFEFCLSSHQLLSLECLDLVKYFVMSICAQVFAYWFLIFSSLLSHLVILCTAFGGTSGPLSRVVRPLNFPCVEAVLKISMFTLARQHFFHSFKLQSSFDVVVQTFNPRIHLRPVRTIWYVLG